MNERTNVCFYDHYAKRIEKGIMLHQWSYASYWWRWWLWCHYAKFTSQKIKRMKELWWRLERKHKSFLTQRLSAILCNQCISGQNILLTQEKVVSALFSSECILSSLNMWKCKWSVQHKKLENMQRECWNQSVL